MEGLFSGYRDGLLTKNEFFIRLLFRMADNPLDCPEGLRLFNGFVVPEREFTSWIEMLTPSTEFLLAGMPSVKRTGVECHETIVKWRECVGAHLVRADEVRVGDKRRFVLPGSEIEICEVEVVKIEEVTVIGVCKELEQERNWPDFSNPPRPMRPVMLSFTYDNGKTSVMNSFAMVWVYRRPT